MKKLREECLSLIKQGHYEFRDAGPLHTPIHGFTLSRDDELDLILETDIDADAKSNAPNYPPGTVRLNTDGARLEGIGGGRAELTGINHLSKTEFFGTSPRDSGGKARSTLHLAEVIPGHAGAPLYTIDWLANIPRRNHHWPDGIDTDYSETTVRSFGDGADALTIRSKSGKRGSSRSAAKLVIEGVTLYICAFDREDGDPPDPGCIIYEGTPEDIFRKKVRTALSFALGAYVVELGHTTYDDQWHIVRAVARSAYSLGGRAFGLGTQQPAPLSGKYENQIGTEELTRMMAGLVAAYDKLDLGNLSWAYWHACCATLHIAPVQFGAAIERLLHGYSKKAATKISTTLLEAKPWATLRESLEEVIDGSKVAADVKKALKGKLINLNQGDSRLRLKAAFESLGMTLGDEEYRAWSRRGPAAHGVPVPQGQEIAAIRDMKLLKGVFRRLLLKIVDGATFYYDYTALHLPRRPLAQAQQPADSAAIGQGS